MMKGIFKNYNENDAMAKIFMMYFAFMHGAIGVFFTFATISAVQSTALQGLTRIMPLDAWGVVLMVTSACFVASVLVENKNEYYFMIVAGTTGMISFGLLAMASIELASVQTNTINYIVIASIDLMIAIIGGVAIWLRRGT